MKVKQVITIVLSAMLGIEVMAADSKPALVYSRPSAKWMGALPLGNGRLGAMVYGGTDVETIALNEVTMWSGQPDPEANNLVWPRQVARDARGFS